MNPISKALEEGYSEDEVVKFISNAYPNLRHKISKAVNTGYSAKEIIKFLSNVIGNNQPSRRSSEGMTQQSIHAQQMQQDEKKQQQLLKAGLSLAGGAVAGRALGKVLPQIAGAISQRGVPKIPGRQAPSLAPEALGAAQEALPQGTPAEPGVEPEKRKAADLVKEMGLEQRIKNLQSNNPPEVVGPAIKNMLTPGQKTWLRSQTDQPIEEIVNEYLQTSTPTEEKKAKLVALPDGKVGTLVDERQGIGTVEMDDGKVNRRKLADMAEEPPELEKQITDLISSIPEDERSAVLAFASYTPEAEIESEGKKIKMPFMGVQFHNGDFYMYPGVTKSQFDKVVSKAVKAKTSGENFWHAFTAGDPSRGAGMYELLQELEKEFGKNFIKFKASEGYDYFKRVREVVKKIEREKRRKKQS